jgi:Rieske Fe-S protein
VTARTAVGHSAICTHQGCAVAPSGAELRCPCHGSRFRARTGAVLAGPAARPLPTVRLSIKKGYVYRA